jgi:hypothetical protein
MNAWNFNIYAFVVSNCLVTKSFLLFQDLTSSNTIVCDLLASYIRTYTYCKLNCQEYRYLDSPLFSLCTTLVYKGNFGSIGYSLESSQNGLQCLLRREDPRLSTALIFPQQVE